MWRRENRLNPAVRVVDGAPAGAVVVTRPLVWRRRGPPDRAENLRPEADSGQRTVVILRL